jgi:FkbM family methyltransferase
VDDRFSRRIKRSLACRPGVYAGMRRGLGLARWALRRPHERDFEFYRYAPRPPAGRVFLDVGANTGTSALSFRVYDRRTPIVSIEPNATLEPDLELVRRLIHGFEYHVVAAGAAPGEATLFVPCFRGMPISGEASLRKPAPEDVWWVRQNVRELRPGEFSVLEQRVPVVPLDDLALAPAHVKIDVEARESEVLEGLRRTLAEYRPTILLEVSERFGELSAWLGEIEGYEPMRWDHRARRLVPLSASPDGQNVFFLAAGEPRRTG